MAEVRKKEKVEKYNIDEISKKSVKKNKKEEPKKESKKVVKKANKVSQEKKSLFTRFRIFCNGVKGEFEKVHWTSKKDMLKYSIATIVFIIFFSLFFYGIDIIFAFVKTLFN